MIEPDALILTFRNLWSIECSTKSPRQLSLIKVSVSSNLETGD